MNEEKPESRRPVWVTALLLAGVAAILGVAGFITAVRLGDWFRGTRPRAPARSPVVTVRKMRPPPEDLQRMALVAQELGRRGEQAKALRFLEQLLKELKKVWGEGSPDLSPYHYNICLTLSGLGRPEEALQRVEEYLERFPDDPRHLLLASSIQGDLGDREKAADLLTRALETPEQRQELIEVGYALPDIYTQLGGHYLKLRRLEGALDAAARALYLDPGHYGGRVLKGQVLLSQLKFDQAYAIFETLHTEHPGDVTVSGHMGTALIHQKKPAEALEVFRSILPEAKKVGGDTFTATLQKYSQCFFDLRRYREAAEGFAELCIRDPENDDALYRLGHCLNRLGRERIGERLQVRYDARHTLRAEEDRAATLDQMQEPASAEYFRAEADLLFGNYKAAWDHFERSMSIQGRIAEVHAGRARLLTLIDRPYDAAIRLRNFLLTFKTPQAVLLSALAEALVAMGDPANAEILYTRALELEPENGRLALAVARFYLENRRDGEKARPLIEARKPEERLGWELHLARGLLAEVGGKAEDALKHLEQASAEAPSPQPELLAALGRVHFAKGDSSRARETFRQALDLDPVAVEIWDVYAKACAGEPEGMAAATRRNQLAAFLEEREAVRKRMEAVPFEESAELLHELAKLYHRYDHRERALNLARLARDLKPDWIAAQRLVASYAEDPGEIFIKIQALSRIVELDPRDVEARQDLAATHADLGVYLDQGRRAAESLVSEERSPRNLYLLARIQAADGDNAKAVENLREAIEKEPNAEYRKLLEELGGTTE